MYSANFHPEERKEIRQVMFNNIIVAFKMTFEQMQEWGVQYESETSLVGNWHRG